MKKVFLLGNLTKDVEELEIGKGKNKTTALTLSVACNNRGKDGEDYTTFVNMLYYNYSEKIIPYLTKGQKIMVEGELDSYIENKNTLLRVVPMRIELCGKVEK